MSDMGRLHTENRNQASVRLDRSSALEIVTLMNREDATVAQAVSAVLENVATAVEWAAQAVLCGGRIIYAGAGTSGRLGLLDASECPPTFGVSDSQVVGLMAGGQSAFVKAKEASEDDEAAGAKDATLLLLTARDVVVGLSASGRTPYTIGVLKSARRMGAKAIAVSCNRAAEMSEVADLAIEVDTGPEVLTGSTRLKAGTAQKMVLNMISTGAMVRSGRVYENLMVDMRATNEKLLDRSERMLAEILGGDKEEMVSLLRAAKYQIKPAIVMGTLCISYDEALLRLEQAGGFVREALAIELPAPSEQDAESKTGA